MIALIARWLGLVAPVPVRLPIRNRRIGDRS